MAAREVVVIGGGPAGAAAAALLARWGRDVLLIDRPAPRPALAESLPPSVRGLLETVGALEVVEGAGFVVSTGNTVWWGNTTRRVEHFPGGQTGWQVERDRFDALLRSVATTAGAELWRPARASQVELTDASARVTVETEEGARTIGARWVIDATGRAGLLARHWRVAASEALRTIALAAVYERSDGWGLPDEGHTLVESAPWGWGWSVPVDGTRRFFTVMFHPTATPVGEDLTARHRDALQALPALGALAAGGRRCGEVFACDATSYRASPVVRDGAIAVGDAASFLDPLSSFGVKKALATGWLGAVTVHTALVTPARRDDAMRFFAAREAEYWGGAAAPLGTLSRDAMHNAGDYWSPRAALDGPPALVAQLRDDPAVRQAFAELRAASPAVVRTIRGPMVPAPVVRGNLLQLEEHLVLDGMSEPLRWLRNVDLVALLALAAEPVEVGALCERYRSTVAAVALPDLLGAVSVLTSRGRLVLA